MHPSQAEHHIYFDVNENRAVLDYYTFIDFFGVSARRISSSMYTTVQPTVSFLLNYDYSDQTISAQTGCDQRLDLHNLASSQNFAPFSCRCTLCLKQVLLGSSKTLPLRAL